MNQKAASAFVLFINKKTVPDNGAISAMVECTEVELCKYMFYLDNLVT